MMFDPVRTVSPPARRAGVAWLILGSLALLFALGTLMADPVSLSNAADPQMRVQLAALNRDAGVTMQMLLYFGGAMLGLYGLAALAIGISVPSGARLALIFGLVLASVATLVAGLNVVGGAARGNLMNAVIPLAVAAIHIWLIRQQIEALRTSSARTVTRFPEPVAYRPMQAYYAAPLPPQGGNGHATA